MSKELRGALHPRGWLLKVGLPIVSMIAVGIAVVVIVHANSGKGSNPQPDNAASVGYPPADLASSDFTATAADAGRGLSSQLSAVGGDGNLLVAAGEQKGGKIARALFYYSTDSGSTWHLAAQQAQIPGKNNAPAQVIPPPAHPATLITNGPNGWVAIGPSSIWNSADGKTWTIMSSSGLPKTKGPGNTPVVLISSASEYLAASRSGTVWVSHNGKSWWRPKGVQGPSDVQFAAADGKTLLLASQTDVWSSNFGSKWVKDSVPTTGGADKKIEAVTTIGSQIAVIREGKPTSKALVYTTTNGLAWTPVGSFGTADGMPLMVNGARGGAYGAVVTGVAHGYLVAFISTDGKQWTGTEPLGSAKTDVLHSATLISHDSAVGVGWSAGSTGTRLMMSLAGTSGHTKNVSLPLPVAHQLAVNGIAASSGTQVAVGAADGYPAIWSSADGGQTWHRASASALSTHQVRKLQAVAHGSAGWVAVGGVPIPSGAAPKSATPVVVTSKDGSSWTSAVTGSAFSGSGLTANSVTAGSSGYVVVGEQGSSAVAWHSTDLTGWHPISLPSAKGSDAYSVTSAGEGYVIVGASGSTPAAWVSRDGSSWSRSSIPLPNGAKSARLHWVAANGQMIVAAGTEQNSEGVGIPFVAESANDGTSWRDQQLPVLASWSWTWDTALTAAGNGFVVMGVEGAGPGDLDVVIWTLRDGSWTEATPSGRGLQGPGVQSITALTQAGNTLTGAGVIATPTSEQPTIWQSPVRG